MLGTAMKPTPHLSRPVWATSYTRRASRKPGFVLISLLNDSDLGGQPVFWIPDHGFRMQAATTGRVRPFSRLDHSPLECPGPNSRGAARGCIMGARLFKFGAMFRFSAWNWYASSFATL